MSEEHSSPIKTPKQLIIVVILSFVIPVGLSMIFAKLVVGGYKKSGGSEETLNRIKPVGEVKMYDPAAAPAATVAAAPAGAAPAAGGAVDGKKVYDTTCVACHLAGVANAPKLGDKAAWEPRIKTGVAALVASVVNGKGVMPPKAGNPSLGDAEIKAAVDFMVDQSK